MGKMSHCVHPAPNRTCVALFGAYADFRIAGTILAQLARRVPKPTTAIKAKSPGSRDQSGIGSVRCKLGAGPKGNNF